ncbi:MAG: 6-bladed beta-propeller [Candidatus Aegiribacteria sp.]|nr:6-bladed beta-propeller [Candidatus Aegiribacteria sp.]
MKRSIESASLISILALLIGCTESNPAQEEVGSNTHQPQYDLMKVDSIGIELGDSNYVFGTIIDATYLIDRRIALLDMYRKKVLLYSEDGEFISQVGSGGSGPGEFLLPFSITALSNGGFAVSDIHAGKVVFFNSTGSLERELIGFYPMAPMTIERGASGSIIGKRINYYYDEEEERVLSGSEYCVWSDSIEPDIVLLENYAVHQSNDRISYNFTTSSDGMFFCCPSSTEEYAITGFSPDGDTAFYTEIPWEITAITQDEIEVARPGIVVPGPGSESTITELTADWEPDSVRNAGLLVGVDRDSRIWVKTGRGETAAPIFDLFDSRDGSFITSVETTLPAIARYWNIEVSESGILGWDHNPADYPRVYILELIEEN